MVRSIFRDQMSAMFRESSFHFNFHKIHHVLFSRRSKEDLNLRCSSFCASVTRVTRLNGYLHIGLPFPTTSSYMSHATSQAQYFSNLCVHLIGSIYGTVKLGNKTHDSQFHVTKLMPLSSDTGQPSQPGKKTLPRNGNKSARLTTRTL